MSTYLQQQIIVVVHIDGVRHLLTSATTGLLFVNSPGDIYEYREPW
jgi:hypothetical protein